MSQSTFFGEFDAVSAKAWKQQIQYELKGADYNESLVWESPEGIKVKPFYHPDDNGPVTWKGITLPKSWKIGEHNYVGDAEKSNLSASYIIKMRGGKFDFYDSEGRHGSRKIVDRHRFVGGPHSF